MANSTMATSEFVSPIDRSGSAWARTGNVLPQNASIEAWNEVAGFNYSVMRTKASYTPKGHTSPIVVPNLDILYRSDNNEVLSEVSSNYKIACQPHNILEFYRKLVDDFGFQIEVAGSIKGGKRVWALANTGNHFALKGSDDVHGYLMLATSYDRSMSTIASFTSHRYICHNMLNWIVNQQSGATCVKVNHSSAVNFDSIKEKLDMGVTNGWNNFEEVAKVLSERKVSVDDVIKFVHNLYGEKDLDVNDEKQPKLKMKKVWEAIKNGPGQNLESAAGTAWGLLNGVTYYEDHEIRGSEENRMISSQFGVGSERKQKAMKYLLELV